MAHTKRSSVKRLYAWMAAACVALAGLCVGFEGVDLQFPASASAQSAPEPRPAPKPVNAAIAGSALSLATTDDKKNGALGDRLRGEAVFRIQRDKDKLRLRGPTPSADDHKTVLGMIAANFPGDAVTDRSKVDARFNQHEGWLSGVSFVLRQLALLRTGVAQIRDNQVSISGVAASPENYEIVQKSLVSELPSGLTLVRMAVKPPETGFVWLAQFQEGALLLSGHAPSAAARAQLSEAAAALFPEAAFKDMSTAAEGAPENWEQASMFALRALRALQSGSVSLSDYVIKVDGVPAHRDAMREIEQMSDQLPQGYIVENEAMDADRIFATP
ncbi:MAG: hypothetical protein NW215_04245 [Hyphomicrobiales bacterium]|nr:hypothetical protein [Hyphomicrobiales bacterium]